MYMIVNDRIDNLSIAELIERRDSLYKTLNYQIERKQEKEPESMIPRRKHAVASLPYESVTEQMEHDELMYRAMFRQDENRFTGIKEIKGEKETRVYLKIHLHLDTQSSHELRSFRDSLCKSINDVIDKRPIAANPSTTAERSPRLMQRLFHSGPYHNAALALISSIDSADNAYESIINKHPEAMFQLVQLKDGSLMCPLRYAFKKYDTNTWLYFFERIKNNPEWYYQFEQQKKEQQAHGSISLQALKVAYDEYNRQSQKHLDGIASVGEVKNAWAQLIKQQQELMPMHLIKKLSTHVYNHDVDPPVAMKWDEIPAAFIAGKLLVQDKESTTAKMMSCNLAPISYLLDEVVSKLYLQEKAALDEFVSHRFVCKA